MSHSWPLKNSGLLSLLRKVAFIGLSALLFGGPSAAEMPYDESEDTEAGAALPGQEQREAERVEKVLRRLEREHERLDELKRTRHPFYSERELNHELRRNEVERSWYKHEHDRLEHERRRAKDRSRQLRRR
jgi:hypothetical protein